MTDLFTKLYYLVKQTQCLLWYGETCPGHYSGHPGLGWTVRALPSYIVLSRSSTPIPHRQAHMSIFPPWFNMEHNHSTLCTLFLPYLVLSMVVLYSLLTTYCHLGRLSSLIVSLLLGAFAMVPPPSTQPQYDTSAESNGYACGDMVHTVRQAMTKRACLPCATHHSAVREWVG